MNVFSFTINTLNDGELPLSSLKGKTLLIVNTASKGKNKNELLKLQNIQNRFKDSNFSVIAFPCRQFLHQESKSVEKIRHRYFEKMQFSFPVCSLTKVNGRDAHPLFKWLKQQGAGPKYNSIEWNFTKFVILGDGVTMKRFSSVISWEKVAKSIAAGIHMQISQQTDLSGAIGMFQNTAEATDLKGENEEAITSYQT